MPCTSANAFQQISASIFDNTTFPTDVVMILAEDGEDGIITGLQTKTFSHDNVNRNYLIYIPDSYDSEIDYH